MVDVRLKKQIHGNRASASSTDLYAEYNVQIPLVCIGMQITNSTPEFYEQIKEIVWNMDTKELICYVESDETIPERMREEKMMMFDNPPKDWMQNLVQDYLSHGWIIQVRYLKQYGMDAFGRIIENIGK